MDMDTPDRFDGPGMAGGAGSEDPGAGGWRSMRPAGCRSNVGKTGHVKSDFMQEVSGKSH
ncbi:hypothetical protein PAGU2595_004620 [Lysobacter xanthus]